jgi:hypothetical protein
MSDFLSFDTFITPKIIRIVFALGLLLIALATLIRVLWELSLITGVILPLIGACIVGLLWRIYCELILVFFDMRDKLADLAARPRS